MACGELVNFHIHVQGEIVEAYKELANDPYYHYKPGCPLCVADMIQVVYKWFNKYLKEIEDK